MLRFTREELHVLMLVLESHLEIEDNDAVFRAGESAANKIRSEFIRLVEKENKPC